ncbi:MAG: hypothetical protein ACQEP6_01685 [Patescibacteria group bacterium]
MIQKLSKTKKKVFLVAGFILSIPIGAFLGAFIGLVAVTFIPTCCTETGCHNCFEFNGMAGYEATAYIGFWLGLFIIPLLYILLINRFIKKESDHESNDS